MTRFFFFINFAYGKILSKSFLGGKNAGFTLIELLVVVLIIGILAAVAVPQYQIAVSKSRATEALLSVRKLRQAQELFWTANGYYAANEDYDGLDIEMPVVKKYRLQNGYGGSASEAWPANGGSINEMPVFICYGFHNTPGQTGIAHLSGKCWCRAPYGSRAEEVCKRMGGFLYGSASGGWSGYELR